MPIIEEKTIITDVLNSLIELGWELYELGDITGLKLLLRKLSAGSDILCTNGLDAIAKLYKIKLEELEDAVLIADVKETDELVPYEQIRNEWELEKD